MLPSQNKMNDENKNNNSGAAAAAADIDSSSVKPLTRGARLLLVDDEPDVLSSFKSGLEAQGYTVDGYTDSELALANFRPDTYHLLILDINMPKIDGFKLFQQLEKKDPKARVCFVTAYDTYFEAFKEIFPDLDIGYFVKKPISLKELANKIELILLKQ
ncbi:MAG: response regulator [Thermoproteota archaeon]|jgi:two-component system, OmpR family, response regulator ChvI|nr:response regulator [Thermoproteota archaeon]